jgi:hypothetical protein
MPPTLPDRKELVWIVWKDACDSSSRVHVDSIKDVQLVCNANIGWILDENEERVVLGHGLSTSGESNPCPGNSPTQRLHGRLHSSMLAPSPKPDRVEPRSVPVKRRKIGNSARKLWEKFHILAEFLSAFADFLRHAV